MSSTMKYPVEVTYNGELSIYFHGYDKLEGDQKYAPGISPLQAVLLSKYNLIEFDFKESNQLGLTKKAPTNKLMLSDKAQMLCILEELNVSNIFSQANAKKDAAMPLLRSKSIDAIRSTILQELAKEEKNQEVEIAKKNIVFNSRKEYELLRDRIANKFQTEAVAMPTSIQEKIIQIDKLNDIELEFDVNKSIMLVASILNYQALNKLEKNLINFEDDIVLKHLQAQTDKDNFIKEYDKHFAVKVDNALQANLVVNPNRNTAVDHFYTSLQQMEDYGFKLKAKGDSYKSAKVINLAKDLHSLANVFLDKKPEEISSSFDEFQTKFKSMLHRDDAIMSEYRANWGTIIKNILVALTGIGAFVIAGKLIHSKATQGRALFLFSKPQTTSELKIEAVENSLSTMSFNKQ